MSTRIGGPMLDQYNRQRERARLEALGILSPLLEAMAILEAHTERCATENHDPGDEDRR